MYPLFEELVVVNDCGVPMRGVSDPLGAPVVAVALKQNVWVELKLLLSAQKLPDLGRALCEQPQALVNIVPEIIIIIEARRISTKNFSFVLTLGFSTLHQLTERRP